MRASITSLFSVRFVGLLLTLAVAGGCTQAGQSPISPSLAGSSSSFEAKPGGTATDVGTTVVSFSGFDPATLMVDINTVTTSGVGQPYIDEGKIQLQILVDATGKPVPCGTAGATYVRFDNFSGGGKAPVGGSTTTSFDLDNLATTTGGIVQNVACGDQICIRAHYVTGGGATKVDTHTSADTPFDVVCPSCTLTQGYWKTHYPDNWPGTVLSSGLTLGTVTYTAAELESIFNTPVGGNGLIALAHQLIAAKLNIANGVSDSTIASAIASADALIGGLVVPPVGSGSLAPAVTSALTQTLTDFNEGVTGPGHCAD